MSNTPPDRKKVDSKFARRLSLGNEETTTSEPRGLKRQLSFDLACPNTPPETTSPSENLNICEALKKVSISSGSEKKKSLLQTSQSVENQHQGCSVIASSRYDRDESKCAKKATIYEPQPSTSRYVETRTEFSTFSDEKGSVSSNTLKRKSGASEKRGKNKGEDLKTGRRILTAKKTKETVLKTSQPPQTSKMSHPYHPTRTSQTPLPSTADLIRRAVSSRKIEITPPSPDILRIKRFPKFKTSPGKTPGKSQKLREDETASNKTRKCTAVASTSKSEDGKETEPIASTSK